MLLTHATRWKSWLAGLASVSIVAFGMAAAKVILPPQPASQAAPLLAGANVPEPVRAIVERACQDCHSGNTHWPWYSAIPPIRWRMESDVNRGRAFMDLSKWNIYSDAQKTGYLLSIAAATQAHIMPPSPYLLMHRDARLSGADVQALNRWALAEQKSIRTARNAPKNADRR